VQLKFSIHGRVTEPELRSNKKTC